jgi:hypothetical protein
MLTEVGGRLPFIEAGGAPYEVGLQLGRHGRAIVEQYLVTTHAWASVMAFRGDPRIAAAKALTEARFPRYWQELQGMAAGLGLPFDDVFAWNCRGDVWAMAPDGCTTVLLPGSSPGGARPVLAHNEDGHAGLRSGCALALLRPAGGKAFTAFVYPASLPGHTFAVTEAGLVQTVNNIRPQRAGDGLPRMILARAVLDCDTIDAAVALVTGAPRAGAFHLSLAQAGDARLVSLEFTHAGCSALTVAEPQCHANHLVHPATGGEAQIVTDSSRSRQERGEEIIRAAAGGRDPLALLWDRARAALPVYRTQPDDPDNENTLATAVIEIATDKVAWRVYDRCGEPARFAAAEGLAPSPRT